MTDEVRSIMTQEIWRERSLNSASLCMAAYVTRTIWSGKSGYQLVKIPVSGRCLPGSFGMANEAAQILTVGPLNSPCLLLLGRAIVSQNIEPEHCTELSPEKCFTSAARREMAVIQHHARARPRQTFLLPTTHDIHPSDMPGMQT